MQTFININNYYMAMEKLEFRTKKNLTPHGGSKCVLFNKSWIKHLGDPKIVEITGYTKGKEKIIIIKGDIDE